MLLSLTKCTKFILIGVFQIWNPKNGQKPPIPKAQAHFQSDLHCKAAIYSSRTCVTNYVKGWGNSEPTSRVAGRNVNVNIYRKSLEEKSSWEGISRTLVEYLITNPPAEGSRRRLITWIYGVDGQLMLAPPILPPWGICPPLLLPEVNPTQRHLDKSGLAGHLVRTHLLL